MKLILLLAAGAFAAQDVTPPVISLTFPKWVAHEHALNVETGKNSAGDSLEWDDATTRDASHALPSWYTTLMGNRADTDQVVSKRASVTCIVDSSSTLDSQKVQNCPDPTCQATDHHDSSLSCDVPRVMMISKSASNDASHATSYVSTSNHWRHSYTNLRGSNERWEHAGDDRIASTGGWDSADDASTQATSRDNVKYAGCTPTSAATCVPRSELGQYLVTYTASDSSGNRAEPIAFTFIFIDPSVPEFSFGNAGNSQAHGATGHSNYMLDWPKHDGTITAGPGNAVWNDADANVETNRNPWGNIISAFAKDSSFQADYPDLVHELWGSTEPAGGVSDLDWAQLTGTSTSLKSFDPLASAGTLAVNRAAKANVEAGKCNKLYGGTSTNTNTGYASSVCTRSTSDEGKWESYDVSVSVEDNYRDSSQIKVFSRVTTGSTSSATLGTWVEHDGGAPDVALCMMHGKTHTIDWYADDEAGIFGWKHKSNPQTRRVQITVTDNTRPTIHPLADTTTLLRTDHTALAQTAASAYINAGTTGTYQNDGTWSSTETCESFNGATCTGKDVAACYQAADCVWTKTLALHVSKCNSLGESDCNNDANCKWHTRQTLSTATGGELVFTTKVGKCRAITENEAPTGEYKETSTFLECGHKSSVLRETYVELGFDVRDNNDGLVTDCASATSYNVQCIPTDTDAQQTNTAVSCSGTTVGTAMIDNKALWVQDPDAATGGAHQLNAEASFSDDYIVKYTYKDTAGNIAAPVTRRVVVVDTTPPELKLTGDCVIQNSAGAHFNDTSTHLSGDNAAADNTAGGLFDHDGIAKFFTHRDDCDREVFTVVTLHEGGCTWTPSHNEHDDVNCHGYADETKKLGCEAESDGSKCFLGVFKWAGVEAEMNPVTDISGTSGSVNHQKFHEYIAGTYSVQYKTQDASGHTTTACRTIENVDHTYPIIQILGSDQMTLEATHQGNYIDDGATCSDQVDGVISQNVEVSGDVVNLSKVGTYTITYNCKDSANNAAPAAQRTVVVAQTSCPKCTMHGGNVVHEASFPYSDAGASCSDVIDGDVTTLCFAAHWEDQTGAKYGVAFDDTDVVNQYDGATTWTDKGYCDAATSGATTTCGTETTATNCVAASGCKWNTYHDCTSADNLVTVSQGTNTHSGAQIGTYYITYRAKNTVGLYNDGQNCRGGAIEYRRTVTVKDTLRPVITLKYNSVKVAQGDVGVGQDHAVDTTTDQFDSDTRAYPSDNTYTSQGNFADDSSQHPSLMAEENTSSVNGWVIGAIASAVAGLALLGYSTRRTAVATSVPV